MSSVSLGSIRIRPKRTEECHSLDSSTLPDVPLHLRYRGLDPLLKPLRKVADVGRQLSCLNFSSFLYGYQAMVRHWFQQACTQPTCIVHLILSFLYNVRNVKHSSGSHFHLEVHRSAGRDSGSKTLGRIARSKRSAGCENSCGDILDFVEVPVVLLL
jgi:hypothetical protein